MSAEVKQQHSREQRADDLFDPAVACSAQLSIDTPP
jgi:hypothetical protein